MAESAPRLRVVDAQTGEVHDECPTCNEWSRKYNGVLSQLGQMRAEMRGDEGHDLFPMAERVFNYWRERCNHPRTKFSSEYFKAMLPYLRDYGEEMFRNAIDGAAYEPFKTRRRNGSEKRHDGLFLITQNPEKFADFANRAPYHLPKAEDVKTLADALDFIHADWGLDRCVAEAHARLKR